MDNIYKFKQDDMVDFTAGSIHGTGRVCGVANNPLPILGTTYIIEIVKTDASISYDYTHMPCFEANMQLIPRQK